MAETKLTRDGHVRSAYTPAEVINLTSAGWKRVEPKPSTQIDDANHSEAPAPETTDSSTVDPTTEEAFEADSESAEQSA